MSLCILVGLCSLIPAGSYVCSCFVAQLVYYPRSCLECMFLQCLSAITNCPLVCLNWNSASQSEALISEYQEDKMPFHMEYTDKTLPELQYSSTASCFHPVTMYLFSPSLLRSWSVFPK
ncbi:hypothetical protein AMECASPLE_034677 [Ameca splendens]|uniref:Secreted protein n=1 Tax=Ameca splendens TaxID=208324 RepID=A0ABV0Y7E8_9TELE